MNNKQLEFLDKLDQDSHNLICQKINLEKGNVIFYPHFFDRQTSDLLLDKLTHQIPWQQDYIKFYGKEIPIPRLTAWYGDEGKSYTYSGITMKPRPWIEPLLFIKKKIEPIAQVFFNSVLVNLYRDGKDSNAWHSDDEPELGENPIIGSVSFGETRDFLLKPKGKNQKIQHRIPLNHGSFLLMTGETQKYWLHQISKTKKQVAPRINLTFRIITD